MTHATPDGVTEVDVVVLGLGPGGEAAATKLASSGLSVVAVDKHLVGGECPYYGCIPSKMMIRAAESLAESRRVTRLAGAGTTGAAWAPGAVLGPGRCPDPGRGHRRLGRHPRGQAAGGGGRDRPARRRTAGGAGHRR